MNRVKIVALLAWALGCAPAAAQFGIYNVVYSFCAQASCADGAVPYAPLAVDASGTFYGTTTEGGAANAGIVFALKPDRSGNLHQSTLHDFCTGDCADGGRPYAGLILDTAGNLYGTTSKRGAAFRLNPQTQQFDVLHKIGPSFAPLSFAGTQFDGHSVLYGTVARGGEHDKGAVFELLPQDDGTWRKKLVYSFCAKRKCHDGSRPFGGVVVAERNRLVGVTERGGDQGAGVVYKIAHGQEEAAISFCSFCEFGGSPHYVTPVLSHKHVDETFFITTGHSISGGTLLEYHTVDSTLTFDGEFDRGSTPLAGGVEDPTNGNIVGTTSLGGSTDIDPDGGGTIFTFFVISHGLNDLHRFCQEANCADGDRPAATLVYDPTTDFFYGTTTKGGAHGAGVVYQFRF